MHNAEPTGGVGGQVVALRQGAGRFSLTPEAGERLRKVLVEQIDQADGWLAEANGVQRRAPLGANPVGTAMAAKFELRAVGDPLSFVNVLTAYREVLRQTLGAVTSAVHSVHLVDADHGADFAALDRLHREGKG